MFTVTSATRALRQGTKETRMCAALKNHCWMHHSGLTQAADTLFHFSTGAPLVSRIHSSFQTSCAPIQIASILNCTTLIILTIIHMYWVHLRHCGLHFTLHMHDLDLVLPTTLQTDTFLHQGNWSSGTLTSLAQYTEFILSRELGFGPGHSSRAQTPKLHTHFLLSQFILILKG